jgi:hypothetical protein
MTSKSVATKRKTACIDFAFCENHEMIESLNLQPPDGRLDRGRLAGAVAREFPSISITFDAGDGTATTLRSSEWNDPHFDWWRFDSHADNIQGQLCLIDDADCGATFPIEVLNRCQRVIARRNRYSHGTQFDRTLRLHRDCHDLSKPLLIADYRHALDTWQWTMRLDGDASLPLQLAALFHDIERIVTEAELRIEHRAADYQAFKDQHARDGSNLAGRLLTYVNVDGAVIRRVSEMIARHEEKLADEDVGTLIDADGLSFFSLNSNGYADYFGPEQTQRKIAWTWNRMRPAARRRLDTLRLRSDVAAMLDLVKEGAHGNVAARN